MCMNKEIINITMDKELLCFVLGLDNFSVDDKNKVIKVTESEYRNSVSKILYGIISDLSVSYLLNDTLKKLFKSFYYKIKADREKDKLAFSKQYKDYEIKYENEPPSPFDKIDDIARYNNIEIEGDRDGTW